MFWFWGDALENPISESESFKFKARFINNSNTTGIIDAKVAVPLKYVSNFWITLEIPLINFEVNLILTWSANRVVTRQGIDKQILQ